MIGIGIDVVDIERFRTTLERTPSMRTRVFTQIELAYVAPQSDPIPSLAARFAAREAVMKAAPFPNVPGGLKDKRDGLVKFTFHFLVEVGERPVFRMRRYP